MRPRMCRTLHINTFMSFSHMMISIQEMALSVETEEDIWDFLFVLETAEKRMDV